MRTTHIEKQNMAAAPKWAQGTIIVCILALITVLAITLYKYKEDTKVLEGRLAALNNRFEELEKSTAERIDKTSSMIKFFRVEKKILDMQPWLKRDHVMVGRFIESVYKYAKLYNVDPYIALAIATKESAKFAQSNYRTHGSSGEIGWYQIMPSTAAGYGYSKRDLKKLENNVRLGIFYYSNILKYNKKPFNALREYNGGRKWRAIDITRVYAESVMSIRDEYIDFVHAFDADMEEIPHMIPRVKQGMLATN